MTSPSERPRLWYVMVPLAAMWVLGIPTQFEWALIRSPEMATTGGLALMFLFGVMLVLAWAFLIYELVRQISLFFRRAK